MQVTGNSQLQMQKYSAMQQSKPNSEQSTSNKTLQSDTVSISQEAMSAASGEMSLQRGGIIIPIRPK